jgi:hypothetical protein
MISQNFSPSRYAECIEGSLEEPAVALKKLIRIS